MTTDRRRSGTTARRGFTLAEAMLAMVLLGLASAGILIPFSSGASVQAEGVHRTLGAILANDLVERIVATPFETIVANLDGYNNSEPEGQLKDAAGVPLSDPMYARFSRELTCVWDSDQDFFILATVRVAYRGRNVATIHRLISE